MDLGCTCCSSSGPDRWQDLAQMPLGIADVAQPSPQVKGHRQLTTRELGQLQAEIALPYRAVALLASATWLEPQR